MKMIVIVFVILSGLLPAHLESSMSIVPMASKDLTDFAINRGNLDTLGSVCDAPLTARVRALAKSTYVTGFKSTSYGANDSDFKPLLEADKKFDSGQFTVGFSAFQMPRLDFFLTSQSAPGISAMRDGLRFASRGKFRSAESAFLRAYGHGNRRFTFDEVFYFLGVARLARGERSLAQHTLCTGIPIYDEPLGDSSQDLFWNFLMAKRLSRM